MDVDTLLSQADLPLTTTDTEAALAATVVRGRRRRRGRRLSVGCAAAAVLSLVSGAAVSMDRGDRHQVVAGPPQSTTTADSGPAESARALSEQRQLSEYPLPPDPSVAAVFAGNESAIIATVTSVGPVESVTAMPNLTYSYAAVGVTVDEVLFGDVSAGTGIVIRDLLGMSEDTASAYEIGGQYVFMLNPAVDVAGTGEMHTPNWAFPLVDDQLLWYDPDTGTDEAFDLAEYRQLVAEDQRADPECPEHTRPPVPLPIRFSTRLPDGEVRVSGEDPQWIVPLDRTIDTTVSVLVTATADPGVVLGSLDYELVDFRGDVVHTYRGSAAGLGGESTVLTWDGTGPEGEAAPPGRYHLTAEAVVARDEGGDCDDATGSRIGSGLGYFRVT